MDRVPANVSRIAVPLQTRPKWVDTVQTPLWICRSPILTSELPLPCSLSIPCWSWASSIFLGAAQGREGGEESSLLFSSPQQAMPQLSTAMCQSRAPSFAISIRRWDLLGKSAGSSVRSSQLHTLWRSWSTEEGQQGWERQKKILPPPSHPLFKDWILWQYFDVLPSTSHKAEKVLSATSWVVLLWFFQTLSGWHWYRQWKEGISVALGILAWDRRIPKGNREKWDNLQKWQELMKLFCSPVPVFPGEKASSKQYCLFYVYGMRRALPAQTNWLHFVFSYILPSRIVCLGTHRWQRERTGSTSCHRC